MKNLIATASLASVLFLSSSVVLAKDNYHRDYDRHDYREHSYNARNHEQLARVIDVDPIYRTVHVSTPHRDCYNSYDRKTRNHSYTSTIAGGIIGGVIGNQFGKGSGNTALTVAGTLLGGSMGRDLGYTSSNNHYYDNNDSCQISRRDHHEQRIDGYFVTYRYKGQNYTTRTEHHPGKYIPVTVNVTPSHHYY